MSTLVQNPFFVVEVVEKPPIIKVVRSAAPFDTLEQITTSFHEVIAALDAIDRSRYGGMHDLRAARGRNDPAFEAALSSERARISSGFRKLAIVVKTPVGRMQVERYLKQDGVEGRVFFDELEALNWLER